MIETVRTHMDNGDIAPRPTGMNANDLEFAAAWLEAYEADPDEDESVRQSLESLATVAAWCRREADRRDRAAHRAAVRRAARKQLAARRRVT